MKTNKKNGSISNNNSNNNKYKIGGSRWKSGGQFEHFGKLTESYYTMLIFFQFSRVKYLLLKSYIEN